MLRHVRCGDDILPALGAAGLPGTRHRWADPLCQGPLARGPRDAWRPRRAEFIAMSYGMDDAEVLAGLSADDAALADLSGDDVVLWFEADLFDQAILCYLVAELSRPERRPASLALVVRDGWPGVSPFHGLVSLSPAQLAQAFAARQAVDAAQAEAAMRAWEAWTGPDLQALDRLRAEPSLAVHPFLGAAIGRWLEELPAVGSGLGRTERTILEEARRAPRRWHEVFRRCAEREEAAWLGDSMWLWLAWRMALEGTPLLQIGETLRVTREGEEVLAGRLDRIALNGYDGWHGAVRYSARDVPFRWDRDAGRVVPGEGA